MKFDENLMLSGVMPKFLHWIIKVDIPKKQSIDVIVRLSSVNYYVVRTCIDEVSVMDVITET